MAERHHISGIMWKLSWICSFLSSVSAGQVQLSGSPIFRSDLFDFFVLGSVKDKVYIPPTPKDRTRKAAAQILKSFYCRMFGTKSDIVLMCVGKHLQQLLNSHWVCKASWFALYNGVNLIFLRHTTMTFTMCAIKDILFFSSPMARQPWGGLGLVIFRRFTITLIDTPHSVGLLWTSDQPVAETSTWQHTTLTRDRHPCLGGIRTHNPSKRAAVDPRLRPHGHRDRQVFYYDAKISNNYRGSYRIY
jgi:hypothetical protein